MKQLLFISLFFIPLTDCAAQSEKAMNKLAETIFNDFKKGRLDNVNDLFVDSVFLDELITKSIEQGELLTQKYSREKIQKQSIKAKAQFVESLAMAYQRFTTNSLDEKLKNVKPKYRLVGRQNNPIKTFDIKYEFYLNDYDALLRIAMLAYDEKRNRFVILSNRVRSSMLDTDLEVSSEKIETERISEDEIELDVPPPPMPPAPRTDEEEVDVQKEDIKQAVEVMPSYPGGEKKMYEFIIKNLRYPEIARENDIQGRVFVSFVVTKDGSLDKVKILRGIGYGCDEEAMRVILRMPNWKPGTQRGKAVAVSYTLPFNFKLQ